MKNKIIAMSAAALLLLSVVGFALTDTKKNNTANALIPLLPASDFVVTLDAQRLQTQGLPQILSSDPEKLAEMNSKIDEFKNRTGLDLRQFQQVAVGLDIKQVSSSATDFNPFILARGTYNAGALVAVAKIVSGGKYREEKIGSRTIYIFTPKEVIEKNSGQGKSSVLGKVVDMVSNGLRGELALTAFDANTVAVGTPARMREALDRKTSVGADVLELIYRHPNSLVSFGGKMPNGLSGLFSLGNDELGNTLNSVRMVSGSFDVAGATALLSLTAKTGQDAQAQTLFETLEGLRMLGKAFLGGMKGEDKKVYARMTENARISRSGSEVVFDLQVPQNDIDILIGKK